DFDRDWGGRQSVATDYALHDNAMLGSRRFGPDLSNVGARRDAEWLFMHLYKPSLHADATTMPDYPQLFQEKEFSGTPAVNALDLQGNDTPAEGTEVVPTAKGVALVAYLQSLNLDYDLTESKRLK
ncbi:cbb3-type cytochrome c oxidase subunit II, partial [Opitutales bacterium]|nr:cbb3-type cytochrome c oxidase subunit II [Opitutales bacterium]